MKCPICNVELVMTERQNIEIDYCPQCRGIWLDRGELDKIIERSVGASPSSALASGHSGALEREMRHGHDDWSHDHGHGKHHRKRKSFLGDLFDFG